MTLAKLETAKKLLRLGGIMLASLLILLGLVWGLIQIPFVQQKVVQRLTKYIAEETQTRIEIESVHIDFFHTLVLNKIYLEDLQADTLVYIDKLGLNLNMLDLFHQQLFLDEINISDAKIHLSEKDSLYNFQFLIDAFSSTDSSVVDTSTQTSWKFGLKTVNLQRVQTSLQLPDFSEDIRLGQAILILDKLDLENQEIQAQKITLKDGTFSHQQLVSSPPSPSTDPMTFPQLGWKIEAANIDLDNIAIRYDDHTATATTSAIDYNHLHLTDLNLSLRQLKISDSLMEVSIEKAVFDMEDKFSLKKLETNLSWSPRELNLEGLTLETPNSRIVNDTKLGYPSLNALATFNENLQIQSQFYNTEIDFRDIETFVPSIGTFLKPQALQKLIFSARLNGTPALLQGKDWSISSGDWLSLKSDFELRQMTVVDSLQLNIDLNELAIETAKLNRGLQTPLPASVVSLGNIQYQGAYQGGIYGGNLKGHLSSHIGKLTHAGYANFNADYSNAKYAVDISLDDFDLRSLTQNDSLGKFSMIAKIAGSGLTLDALSTRIDATVKEANLIGYTYHDIDIHGQITQRAFSGEIDIRDEHLALDFDGKVNFNDSLPQIHFQAQLDTLNLDKLNLSAQPFGVRANFISNIEIGQNKQLEGTAHITNLSLSGSGKTYAEDSIKFITKNLPDKRQQLSLISDIFDVDLVGNYQLAALPGQLIHFVESYFPFSINDPDSLIQDSIPSLPDQDFQLSINLKNPHHLSRLFIPNLTQLDTLGIDLMFDSKKDLLDGHIFIPRLTYDGMQTDSILFEMHQKDSSILVDLQVANFRTPTAPEGKYLYSNIRMKDEKMDADFRLANDDTRRLFAMSTSIKSTNKDYFLQLKSGFYLNDEEWTVNPENSVKVGENDWEIRELSLQRGKQQVAVNGTTQDSLDIQFNYFEVAEIANLFSIEEYDLQGEINGVGHLMSLQSEHPYYTADIGISGISLNEDPIGDLSVAVNTNKEANLVGINAKMTGRSSLNISGTYDVSQTNLAVGVDIQRFQLALIRPFTSDYLSQISGTLTGKLKIEGKSATPKVAGSIGFENAAARINELNTYYKFPNETLSIQPNKIRFDQFAIVDTTGRKASLTGELTHQDFNDIRFNLNVNSNEFLFLNTKSGDNDLFYGKMLIELSSVIKGNPTNVSITGKAKTLSSTNLTVFTPEESNVVVQEDYLLFVSPEEFDQTLTVDSSEVKQKGYQVNMDGFTMDLNLEITPDAQFTYVLDSLTGEKIEVSGTGNLTMGLNSRGDVSLRGIYEVNKGNYHFSYESLLTKDFQIQPGSNIVFSGDPLDARLAITATYTARTSTYELISNELSDPSSQLAKDSKKRTNVNVELRLFGPLMKPDLNFDIQVPNENSGFTSPITDAVSRKLAQIRQDESELNQQVMGLLLFGSFIQKGSSLSGGPNLGSLAVSSISGFLTNQLNQLADKYIQGVQVNINLESYQSNELSSNTVSQLDIGLSRQLLNDRLTVSFDTGVGLESSSFSTSLTQVTGSFVLSYKLTEDGRYTLQVFRKSDADDPLNSGNNTSVKTGVGATFRKTFD